MRADAMRSSCDGTDGTSSRGGAWRFPAGEKRNCTHCGVCVGVCPDRALELDEGSRPFLARPGECRRCRLCERVCPGREIDYIGLGRFVAGGERGGARYDHFLGPVRETVLAHDTLPGASLRSSSGGAVTALMRFALQTGRVDAVCSTAPDPRDPTRFVAALVTDPAGLEAGRQAKYQVIPVGSLLRDIAAFRRVAFVGPGCQVAGVRKAQALVPRLREKIPLVVGYFCSTGNLSYGATEFLLRKGCGCGPGDVAGIEFRHGPYPGAFRAARRGGGACLVTKDDYKWLYALYTEPRCMACVDFTAELADISFGDPYGACTRPEGQSAGIVRTEAGRGLLRAAAEAGELAAAGSSAERIVEAQRMQFMLSRAVLPRRARRAGRLRFDLPAGAPKPPLPLRLKAACILSVFALRRLLAGVFWLLPFGAFSRLSRAAKRT